VPLRTVGIQAVGDVDHGHHSVLLVDAVNNPVRPSTGAVAIVQWWKQLLADPAWLRYQRACYELVRGYRDGLR
jgi:hypothetical protein